MTRPHYVQISTLPPDVQAPLVARAAAEERRWRSTVAPVPALHPAPGRSLCGCPAEESYTDAAGVTCCRRCESGP